MSTKQCPNLKITSKNEEKNNITNSIFTVDTNINSFQHCLSCVLYSCVPTNCFYLLVFHFFFFVAPPRQCIDLFFDEKYSIEPSWECKFDHIEVRDGPFGFSPIIGRYCGQQSPLYIRSSGRYLWIKFVADGELEAMGFSASYNFTAGNTRYIFFILADQSRPIDCCIPMFPAGCKLVQTSLSK